MKKVVPLEGFGGGGTPLNFKIVAYATEEEMAAAQPKENTIGVITEIPITGYKFSSIEPEDMNEGEVWICTGKDSGVAFDIVDDVTLHPLSMKQYIGGTLVEKAVFSYQNSRWVDWIRYLCVNGDERIDITGGWQARAWNYASDFNAIAPTKTNTDEYMLITVPTSQFASGVVEVKNDIDLTNIKTLKLDYEAGVKYNRSYLMAIKRNTTYLTGYSAAITIVNHNSNVTSMIRDEVSLDVSGLNGEYDIVIATTSPWGSGGHGFIYIYSLSME